MGRVRLPRFKSAPVLAKSSPPFFLPAPTLSHIVSDLSYTHLFAHSLDSFPLHSFISIHTRI